MIFTPFSYEQQKIVTSGLVLNLDAGNVSSYPGTGTTWSDLTVNNNNTTLLNSPTFSSNNSGYFTFNGTNQSANSVSTINLSSTNAISISLWFKVSGTSLYIFNEFSSNFNNNANSFFFDINEVATGKISFADIGVSSLYNQVQTVNTYNDNKWHNLCVVSNRALNASNHNFIYVDGVLDTVQGSLNNANNSNYGNYTMYFFSRANTTYFTNGNLSSYLLYNRALTAQEVSQNFNVLRGRYGI